MKTLTKMDSEIKKCVDLLLDGKVILYPTDTVWGIGCDATNVEAINRIYKIKERQERKSDTIEGASKRANRRKRL